MLHNKALDHGQRLKIVFGHGHLFRVRQPLNRARILVLALLVFGRQCVVHLPRFIPALPFLFVLVDRRERLAATLGNLLDLGRFIG